MRQRRPAAWLALLAVALLPARAAAHSGPPFPIESDRLIGPYRVSVWTDPDTTQDGTPGGQFWVTIAPRDGSQPVPADTSARVAVTPGDQRFDDSGTPGSGRLVTATPVRGDAGNQFAAVLMEREGPYAVRVTIRGPLGAATLDSQVTATFDTRPAPVLLLVYLLPFVLLGVLWTKVLLARRRAAPASGEARP